MRPPFRSRVRRLVALATAAVIATTLIAAGSPARAADVALGARLDAEAVTFAVRSQAATRVEVHVYAAATGADAALVAPMTAADGVFTAVVDLEALAAAGVTGTVYYGYRAWGPNWTYDASWTPGSSAGFVSDVDAAGNRFNPNKLLWDPYALELSHDPTTPAMTDESVYRSGERDRLVDTGRMAPKGIVLADVDGDTGTAPTRPFAEEVVYETHVRGLTAADPSVPRQWRGTYRGAAEKAEYLAGLGVTAVEFLPLAETPNDVNDADPTSTAGDNYWGYMTLNHFAPDRRHAADKSPGGPTAEFQAMVKAFHEHGLKVYVDVVHNHTGEGGPVVPGDTSVYNVMSYRGLDNATYYSLTADRQSPMDNTGVGGNVNTYNPITSDLIVDSLRHWRDVLGVDGFRHDLASVLGNACEHGCFRYDRDNPDTALNRITAALPARPVDGGTGTDWIAEPWALGDGTYQVGNFPPDWAEWNGRYRDAIRADQNRLGVTPITPGTIATRVAGSSDLYGDDGRRPASSVNFLVAHDGFTLADLYSCNAKDNGRPWPYGPSDGGTDDNVSWDQGGDPVASRQAARTGTALLALSAGTPMITGGDERLRSVSCNNNPYNLDAETNYLDWSPTAEERAFEEFTRRLLHFRADHPALRPVDFHDSDDSDGDGLGAIDWFTAAGTAPDAAFWENPDDHALAWRLDGSEHGDPAAAIYVAYNGWSGPVDFTLPAAPAGTTWHRVTDTASWAEGGDQVARPGEEDPIDGSSYTAHGRSLVLLIAR